MPGLKNLPELQGLSQEARKDVLEKARYEVFVRQRRTGTAALYLVFSLIVGFLVAISWQIWLGAGALTGFLVPVICLGIAGVLFRVFYGRMIRIGVRACLKEGTSGHAAQKRRAE